MRDSYNRTIDYMRVSITDRCNLRCKYCMPEDIPLITHDDILRYEEILRLCAAMAGLGIKTIRVTGGEPLSRKGCCSFIKELKAIPGIEHVTLTTNGVLLEPHIEMLTDCKLDGVNISVDSLNPETYRKITGQDEFHRAWRSMNLAVEAGLRVKLNCVPIKGLNENEIVPIAGLTQTLPIDVRFIELMPTDAGGGFQGVSGEKIIGLITGAYPDLTPDPLRHGFGPARYFKSTGLKGGIGLIDAVSNHFCGSCNRLRLTSEGRLRLCLYHNEGLDLRGMLRNGASDDEITHAIKRAVYNRPERHRFGSQTDSEDGIKRMSRLGG